MKASRRQPARLDAAFNPAIKLIAGDVQDSAIQADGKLIVAGYFQNR